MDMNFNDDKKMPGRPEKPHILKSFRLSTHAYAQLEMMAMMLQKTQTAVVEDAIDVLYQKVQNEMKDKNI